MRIGRTAVQNKEVRYGFLEGRREMDDRKGRKMMDPS